jgi:tRNA-Thr(GGU) m(6)t(6)A37 methyltransferase TsaA
MFVLEVVATVRASRTTPIDDDWGNTVSVLELAPQLRDEALAGLDAFSHVEVVYLFDRVTPAQVVRGSRHPRGNEAWPKVGVFAQRGKNRPNRLGVSVGRIVGVHGRELHVAELDAIDGTPVVDIKPVIREFVPRGEIRQPAWATELMRDYWRIAPAK